MPFGLSVFMDQGKAGAAASVLSKSHKNVNLKITLKRKVTEFRGLHHLEIMNVSPKYSWRSPNRPKAAE